MRTRGNGVGVGAITWARHVVLITADHD